MKKFITIILIIVAAILVLPFAFTNKETVVVTYFAYSIETYVSYLILGAFIIGVIVSMLFFAISNLGWKIRAKGLKKQVEQLLKQRKCDEIAEEFESQKKSS